MTESDHLEVEHHFLLFTCCFYSSSLCLLRCALLRKYNIIIQNLVYGKYVYVPPMSQHQTITKNKHGIEYCEWP